MGTLNSRLESLLGPVSGVKKQKISYFNNLKSDFITPEEEEREVGPNPAGRMGGGSRGAKRESGYEMGPQSIWTLQSGSPGTFPLPSFPSSSSVPLGLTKSIVSFNSTQIAKSKQFHEHLNFLRTVAIWAHQIGEPR